MASLTDNCRGIIYNRKMFIVQATGKLLEFGVTYVNKLSRYLISPCFFSSTNGRKKDKKMLKSFFLFP